MNLLHGKAVLVTGAGSGIGRATTWELARRGAAVVAFDLDEAGARATAEQAPSGTRVIAYPGDAAEEADVRAAVEVSESSFGRIDGVFANAGISGGPVGLLDAPAELWLQVLRTNVLSCALAVKVAAARMSAGGSIVLAGSVAALRANAGGAPYSASKAAVVNLAQTAAAALAGTGVRINAICPGLVRTAMTEGLFALAEQRGTQGQIGQLNPLGRPGDAEEIARVVAFLLSDDASYVNGQALSIDGGLSASHPFARWRR
jgi:NAD(P)-dependent dehydrogenase (short-subunit alcohol dehydrogenase family)